MDATFEQLKELLVQIQPDANGVARAPTERELAKALDVQRSTLRERLASLEVLGLIRRTQGSGTYLALPDSGFVRLYFEMALKLGYFNIEQLQQAREMLEHEVARVAACSATPDDLAALQAALDRMLTTQSVAEGDEADYQFHLSLMQATHNPVITLIMEGLASVLYQVLQQRRQLIRTIPGAAERTNATHILIVQAIFDHDPEQAVRAMENHFAVWNEESTREGVNGL
ncbi:MAG: FCD domain-containing protein [Chloroflexales bacterium]|nr:FCD domain-containing protein [Chloroflexales bacterium]